MKTLTPEMFAEHLQRQSRENRVFNPASSFDDKARLAGAMLAFCGKGGQALEKLKGIALVPLSSSRFAVFGRDEAVVATPQEQVRMARPQGLQAKRFSCR